MKTIEDLDQMINELSEQSQYKDNRGVLVKDKKWKKAQSRVSFLNDMRLYLFSNPDEKILQSHLKQNKEKVKLIKGRFMDWFKNNHTELYDMEDCEYKETRVAELLKSYNSKAELKKLRKQISNLNFFIVPESYKKELDEFNASQEIIRNKVFELEAQRDTVLLKIQLGSNQVLDKLVTEVDNLADLSIMNSQFLLS